MFCGQSLSIKSNTFPRFNPFTPRYYLMSQNMCTEYFLMSSFYMLVKVIRVNVELDLIIIS